jgi:hypothetical protein
MPIQTAADSISNSQGSPFGFKNRIINGAMVIDQRNAGASVTMNGGYTLDRWDTEVSQSSKLSIQQQTSVVPTGFTYAMALTSLSSYSVGSSETFNIKTIIEGFNCADLGWGTASASTVTLSFWVRSSLTGTFGGALQNGDNNRAYPFSYTISSANTWEQKTVTVAGDTTGTWGKTNGRGIQIRFSLGAGSTFSGTAGAWVGSDIRTVTGATSVVGTNGATFYITGVQLEKGSQATAFDYRDFGNELRLCQRYCVVWGPASTHIGLGTAYSSTAMNITVPVPVPMRTTPTPSKTTTGGNWLQIYVGSTGTSSNSTPETGEAGQTAYRIYTPSSGTGWTGGTTSSWCQVLPGATFTLSAEL